MGKRTNLSIKNGVIKKKIVKAGRVRLSFKGTGKKSMWEYLGIRGY